MRAACQWIIEKIRLPCTVISKWHVALFPLESVAVYFTIVDVPMGNNPIPIPWSSANIALFFPFMLGMSIRSGVLIICKGVTELSWNIGSDQSTNAIPIQKITAMYAQVDQIIEFYICSMSQILRDWHFTFFYILSVVNKKYWRGSTKVNDWLFVV